MHLQQKQYCESIKARFPKYFKNTYVLDFGSLDINGNNRYLFENSTYLGIDVAEGKNVDLVSLGHEFKSFFFYGTIISTETFEHDEYYRKTFKNIVENLLEERGLFLFTCATTGRKEHGTINCEPLSAPLLKTTYYKNLVKEDFLSILNFDDAFSFWEFSNYHQYDLGCVCIKR